MIYLIGTLPSMIATGMNPFINAQGYSTIGMLSVAIGAVANMYSGSRFYLCNWNLGIRGAAIATILSQFLSASFVLYFLRYKSEFKVQFLPVKEWKAKPETGKRYYQSWNCRLYHAA